MSKNKDGRTRRLRWISRQKFPKRTGILRIPSKPYSVHSVHSAIGSRLNGMIFLSFRKRDSSKKNTNTVYSEYSYSGIVPKERSLRLVYTSDGIEIGIGIGIGIGSTSGRISKSQSSFPVLSKYSSLGKHGGLLDGGRKVGRRVNLH